MEAESFFLIFVLMVMMVKEVSELIMKMRSKVL